MRAMLSLGLLIVISGCASGSMRRDLDVSGEVPRAITLGAFSPSCLFFCFVTNTTTQGDVVREEILEGEPFVVHDKTAADFKVKRKPKKPTAAKPTGAPPS